MKQNKLWRNRVWTQSPRTSWLAVPRNPTKSVIQFPTSFCFQKRKGFHFVFFVSDKVLKMKLYFLTLYFLSCFIAEIFGSIECQQWRKESGHAVIFDKYVKCDTCSMSIIHRDNSLHYQGGCYRGPGVSMSVCWRGPARTQSSVTMNPEHRKTSFSLG